MQEAVRDHVVVCNWTSKTEMVITELRSDAVLRQRPIIVITETPEALPQNTSAHFDLVFVVPGDPMDDKVLRRANVKYAETAIVLADGSQGAYAADMKSILTALAIEAIEPRVYTVVELLNTRNRGYFEHTQVDEIVCTEELLEKLLSQSAVTHGASAIYQHLLTATRDTNELYKIPVPPAFRNRSYEKLEECILADGEHDVILLGFITTSHKERAGHRLLNHEGHDIEMEQLVLNPPRTASSPNGLCRNYKLRTGDKLVVMAYQEPSHLLKLSLKDKSRKRPRREVVAAGENGSEGGKSR